MKVQIRMDTKTAAADIAAIANKFPNEKIILSDGEGFSVNAKSVVGNLYAQVDFKHIYLETEKEHWYEFKDFIIS